MPTNKDLIALTKKVDEIYTKMEAHLEDAGNVRTNIEWLKRWMWVCITASLTTVGTITTALVVYLLNK